MNIGSDKEEAKPREKEKKKKKNRKKEVGSTDENLSSPNQR